MNKTLTSVPGSILLAGEYTVTKTGGLGLAAGVNVRARLIHQPPAKVTIDTGEFYLQDGTKKGLGSSAAAALLVSHFMGDSDKSLQNALRTHRQFQGGMGSGYDVYTSFYGGAGLFSGGTKPKWTTCSWPENLKGYLIFGNQPVNTSSAITQYFHWCAKEPQKAIQHFQRNNAAVHALYQSLQSAQMDDFFAAYKELIQIGQLLGERIGVSAEPKCPHGLSDIQTRPNAALKCVGAGNELGLLLYMDEALSAMEKKILNGLIASGQAEVLTIMNQGLVHEG